MSDFDFGSWKPESGLVYRSLEDMTVIEGPQELQEYVLSNAWMDDPADGVLFVRPFSETNVGYYVWDSDGFHVLAQRAYGAFEHEYESEAFDVLHIHEGAQVPAVDAGGDSDKPALVFEDGELVGALVEPPGRDPHLSRRPAPAIVLGEETGVILDNEGSPPVIERTPHMNLSNERPKPGDTFTATVFVDTEPPQAGEETENLVIDWPPDTNEVEVLVTVHPSRHFDVSPRQKRLTIKRDEDRSSDAPFEVRVKPDLGNAENAALTATFGCRGRPSGKIVRRVELDLGKAKDSDSTEDSEPEPSLFRCVTAEELPDLTVKITEPEDGDGLHFECELETSLPVDLDPAPTLWTFKKRTDAEVGELMEGFTKENLGDEQRLARLTGVGKELFRKAPKNFRTSFWKLADAGLRSIYIVSDEPFIPWELMIPNDEEAAKEHARPLGADFVIGRRVDRRQIAPRQDMPIENSWVIAPDYANSSVKVLEKAPEESKLVTRLFRGSEISPASYDHIDKELLGRSTSLIHFACHGSNRRTNGQEIYLAPVETLWSEDLGGAKGFRQACRAKQPLVFLNACEVGRQTAALVGIGGFAPAFIEIGARCVIAPLWSVDDAIAHKVATEFYENVAAEPEVPFAEQIRRIRCKAYEAGGNEDTYAAYCFYGDPLAAQVVGPNDPAA